MAWTQADLDLLDQAIKDRGFVRGLNFSDQSITFDSLDDMWKLRSVIAHALEANAARNFRFIATSKGV